MNKAVVLFFFWVGRDGWDSRKFPIPRFSVKLGVVNFKLKIYISTLHNLNYLTSQAQVLLLGVHYDPCKKLTLHSSYNFSCTTKI